MYFPEYRPRRFRRTENLRRMVRETVLTVDQLVYPLFVLPGKDIKNPVRSMPDVYQFSVDRLMDEVATVVGLNLPAVLLFGLPQEKDAEGSEAFSDRGAVQEATRPSRNNTPTSWS